MGNILKMNDFVGAGFERLDDNLIEQHAPKIQWGQLYRDMSKDDQIRYLQRLASTMNHSAALIQKERDALIALCEKKEKQLIAMAKQVDANNAMLQQQVTRMNSDRQAMVDTITRLRAESRAAKVA